MYIVLLKKKENDDIIIQAKVNTKEEYVNVKSFCKTQDTILQLNILKNDKLYQYQRIDLLGYIIWVLENSNHQLSYCCVVHK